MTCITFTICLLTVWQYTINIIKVVAKDPNKEAELWL